jgi:hypothetical protein
MSLTKSAAFRLALVLIVVQLMILVIGRQVMLDRHSAEAAPTWQEQPSVQVNFNCRYGVAVVGNNQVDRVASLGAGWFLNFGAGTPGSGPANIEFVPMISVKQNKDAQGNYLPGYYTSPSETILPNNVNNRPGSLWIIGNEIDRGPDPGQIEGGQGDIKWPEVYAQAYHNLYYLIKGTDPTAQVAISALVEVTPGRLQYLDNIWEAYQDLYGGPMPVDVWNMHLYVLPEAFTNGQANGIASIALGTDPALAIRESGNNPANCPLASVYCWAEHDDMDNFIQQVVAMRTWMKLHGQQHKPLILSEYSILYPYEIDPGGTCHLADEYGQCFTPQRVAQFAINTFNYLHDEGKDPNLGYPPDNNRLVQQWLWFPVRSSGIGHSSNLLEQDLSTFTPAGQMFNYYAYAQPLQANLLPIAANGIPAFTPSPTATVSATLTLQLVNNGTIPATPFSVTFYSNAGLTQEIGSAVVQKARGCSRSEHMVTTTWDNLTSGVHPFWAKVDSLNNVGEANENDNVIQGFVIINPQQRLLPLIHWRE